MSGVTVIYECMCSDADESVDSIPATCPEHGASWAAEPYRNPLAGGVRAGHDCWIRDLGREDAA